MVLMQKTIADKSLVLKVAHTRLEARVHRPESEQFKDQAQFRFTRNHLHITISDNNIYIIIG